MLEDYSVGCAQLDPLGAPTRSNGCLVCLLRSAGWVDNKLWVGEALPIAAEEDVFEALGLRYLAPRERIGQIEHAPMAEWSAGFVETVFAKRCV